MSYAKALLEIISNTQGGVVVYKPAVNDLCRDIQEETGVMVKPERQSDHWEVENHYGGIWEKSKPNNRKHKLTI